MVVVAATTKPTDKLMPVISKQEPAAVSVHFTLMHMD